MTTTVLGEIAIEQEKYKSLSWHSLSDELNYAIEEIKIEESTPRKNMVKIVALIVTIIERLK